MEGDGGDDSEFGSVTSSQVSFPRHSGFASPALRIPPENSDGDRKISDSGTGSDHTEVLGDQFSASEVRTPILTTSQDSVFRTPPEEHFLSSTADSDPTVRVSVTDPASSSVAATGYPESQSSVADKVGVLVATPDPLASSATQVVRVSGTEPALVAGVSESPSLAAKAISVLEATPDSTTVNVRVSQKEPDSAFVVTDGDPASPSSGAENVRVSEKEPDSAFVGTNGDPPSSLSGAENVRVSEPDSAFVGTNGDPPSPPSVAENVRVSEKEPDSAFVGTNRDPASPPPGAENVRISEKEPDSAFVSTNRDPASPPSGAENVRVSEKEPDSTFFGTNRDPASPPPGVENVRVLGEAPASALAGNVRGMGKSSGSASAAPTEKVRVLGAPNDPAKDVSLMEVIEALLRNSGEAGPNAEDEDLSYVDVLRKIGLSFPE